MADELPDVWIARTYLEPDSPVIYAYREKDFDSIRYTPAARLTAAQEQVERLREALRARMVTDYYCEQCERGWMEENVEEHAPGCLAAKDRQ